MSGLTKAQRRAELQAGRRAVSDQRRRDEADRLCEHLAAAVTGCRTVCAYLPVGTEPGSPAMVDRLAELCETVLLPVVRDGGSAQALWWGRYRPGALVSGRFGLQEPAGDALPPNTVADADVVIVPALAVDRAGTRLGRGGGYYDRTLPLCRRDVRLVAVVRDCELLDVLPAEAHDVPMTHALTPGGGLVVLDHTRPVT